MTQRKPELSELLAILLIEMQSLSIDLYEDVLPSNVTKLYAISDEHNTSSTDSLNISNKISNLGDGIFSAAATFLVEISCLVQEHTEKLPTLRDFCLILIKSMNHYEMSLFRGYSDIKSDSKKIRKIILSPGDIVLVPSDNHLYFILAFLTTNQFGLAYGVFRRKFKELDININRITELSIRKYPVYSGNQFIANGNWRIIGNNPKVLSLFHKNPEIFHNKQYHKDNEDIDPFGSGESPDGTLRDLTQQEAVKIGLFTENYETSYLEWELEQKLKN